jgi:hypothetical protein
MNTYRLLPEFTIIAKRVALTTLFFCFLIFTLSSSQAADVPAAKKKRRTVVIKYTPQDKETSKLVPLKTVSFKTVKRICDPLLSKKGTIAFLPERNTVIVYDKQSVVDKVCALINKIDMPAVNIRVDVDFLESGKSRQDHLNVRFGNTKTPRINNQFRIINGKMVPINRIAISAGKRSGTTSRNTSQFIMTKSGHAASIWAGRRIADPSWLRNYRLSPTIIVPIGGGAIVVPGTDNDIVWADVGASLYVLPRALGNDMIEVEIYPVVSYLVDEPQTNRRRGARRRRRRRRQSVRVEKVSTTVTVKSGQRISIGGVISSNKAFYTNLFGPDFLSRDESNSILDMYLTATIVKPGSSGRRSYIPRTPDVRPRY